MKRYMKMAEAMTMEPSKRPSDFIDALVKMQKACKVDDLKLSDWGIKKEDLPEMVKNAKETMGGLFQLDPRMLTEDEILAIYEKAYR